MNPNAADGMGKARKAGSGLRHRNGRKQPDVSQPASPARQPARRGGREPAGLAIQTNRSIVWLSLPIRKPQSVHLVTPSHHLAPCRLSALYLQGTDIRHGMGACDRVTASLASSCPRRHSGPTPRSILCSKQIEPLQLPEQNSAVARRRLGGVLILRKRTQHLLQLPNSPRCPHLADSLSPCASATVCFFNS